MQSLKHFVTHDDSARKIFGKKEIRIIQKQLDGITLTQSEKNRLSRSVRKKFEVIKKLNDFQNDFSLKKGADTKKRVQSAISLILQDKLKDTIKAILLFGSHVRGTVTGRSDIDICVVFSNITFREATNFRIRILGNFSEKVDIQVFNTLPQKIKKSIAAKHTILYKTKDFDNLTFTVQHLKRTSMQKVNSIE